MIYDIHWSSLFGVLLYYIWWKRNRIGRAKRLLIKLSDNASIVIHKPIGEGVLLNHNGYPLSVDFVLI